MKFVVSKPKENIVHLARKLGYRPISSTEAELSCVRPLAGRDYPRFHLFIFERSEKSRFCRALARQVLIKEDKKKKELSFGLHLDQKKPSYSGSPTHSGEYNGDIVEKEVERIKKVLEGLQ